MRGATVWFGETILQVAISIHAPHAGSDFRGSRYWQCHDYFNPRSPCGERLDWIRKSMTTRLFQSTLPMRGATLIRCGITFSDAISIHAPHAGSDQWFLFRGSISTISIHAPHAGSDLESNLCQPRGLQFQSTLPMRGATVDVDGMTSSVIISIHAPHAGSDGHGLSCTIPELVFQSTLPMRGATGLRWHSCLSHRFQSTLPMRGATLSTPI